MSRISPNSRPKRLDWAYSPCLFFLTLNGLWYQVPAESEAVKLRFGKLIEEGIKPGLHFKLPLGIDRVQIEPVQRQLKMEFGFTTPGATSDLQYGARGEEENVEKHGHRRPQFRPRRMGRPIPHY